MGLNSGEVVVRAIGSDLHMDYTAVGQTTHLAARMEQTATPGTILLAPATLQLAEGYVQVSVDSTAGNADLSGVCRADCGRRLAVAMIGGGALALRR